MYLRLNQGVAQAAKISSIQNQKKKLKSNSKTNTSTGELMKGYVDKGAI